MAEPIGKNHPLTRWLEEQPDMRHIGLEIFTKPVRHFARSLLIYDSLDEGGLRGVWMIKNLWAFDLEPELQDFIGRKSHSEIPSFAVESFPAILPDAAFRNQLDRDALPFLRSINSMERLYELSVARRDPGRSDPVQQFRLELAMGNFAAARRLVFTHGNGWLNSEADDFDDEEVERTKVLCALLDGPDYGGLARHFHEWEATVAERLELGHIWEPSPFPFEDDYRNWVALRQ